MSSATCLVPYQQHRHNDALRSSIVVHAFVPTHNTTPKTVQGSLHSTTHHIPLGYHGARMLQPWLSSRRPFHGVGS